jgi:hypothetical protein
MESFTDFTCIRWYKFSARFVPVMAKFQNYNVLYSGFNTYFVTTVYTVIVTDMIIGIY